MSTKTAFFTHEPPNVGKISSFLPMTFWTCTQNRTFLCMKLRLEFNLERNVKHNLEPTSVKPSHHFKLERKALNNNKSAFQHLEMLGFAWI
jgi:hypothetical protein